MDCFWMLVRFWCAFVCQESFKALCVRRVSKLCVSGKVDNTFCSRLFVSQKQKLPPFACRLRCRFSSPSSSAATTTTLYATRPQIQEITRIRLTRRTWPRHVRSRRRFADFAQSREPCAECFHWFSVFPCGIEKVLNCGIALQDLEKVLNWPKCTWSIEKVWKFQIQPFLHSSFCLYRGRQFCRCFFALCSTNKILEKWRKVMVLKFFHLVLKRHWISMENDLWKCLGTLFN